MTVQHVRPQGAFEIALAAVFRLTLKLLLKPALSPRWSIAAQRRWLQGMCRLNLTPRGVVFEAAQVGGVQGEWVRPATGALRPGTVLFLHGGAYCVGSPATHRPITAGLALRTGMRVLALDYRLAPEHPHPAALHDALAACAALRSSGPLVLAGDSAGGGLALATALALRDAHRTGDLGDPRTSSDPPGNGPVALFLIAPWGDVTLRHLPAPTPGEAMLQHDWVAACAAHYTAGSDASLPAISPLLGHLKGLPRVLVQVGTDDLLHAECLRLHDALEAAAVPVVCEVVHARWHVFQLQAGALPSANQALDRAAAFIASAVDQAAAVATPAGAEPTHHTVILGAGMSGLCMAVQLKKAGIHDFVMLEKSAGLGGTWWDNTYPGAHVDVPAPLYSFSFAPNPHWTRRFASAPEIQRYMQQVARRFGITPHLRLNTALHDARFDEATGLWHFSTHAGQSLRARYFVCSTGPLSQARWPDIPGLADFKGKLLHSARWDHRVDLTGQRVAVIGTGSTASQLIPPIARQAARLHVFQRTANWVLPRMDRRYHALDRLIARVPPLAALVRYTFFRVLELGRKGFEEGTAARHHMLALAARHRQRQVPEEALRQQLTPGYPLGCKRLIYSNDYLRALARPNAELVTHGITRITAHGIQTIDGQERPLDALVCATGFDTVHLLSSVQVQGRNGLTLQAAWADGPEAFHGITVTGFPNLFLMLGPNTATGHTSTLLFIEPAVRYAIQCMQHLQARKLRWLDLRPEVYRAHNEMLQARLRGSVWTTCQSWYRTEAGKVVALWPGYTREYQQAIAKPDWAHYHVA
jgi:cation diffusion facilitator CzcD-associated flavoprotein CzcO/acetyl esterase/lipase